MKEVTKINFKVLSAEKRAGDPSALISNNNKIKNKMNWIPKYDNLELICQSAYLWEQKLN